MRDRINYSQSRLSVVGRRHALAREELALSSAVCRLPTVATTASERSLVRTARILCCSYFLVASHQSSSIDTILNGNLTGKKEFITSCLSLSKRKELCTHNLHENCVVSVSSLLHFAKYAASFLVVGRAISTSCCD